MSESFDENYLGSGTFLLRAVEKYGEGSFKCSILESINGVPTICDSEEELNKSEEYYIDYYNCVDSDEYYNLKPGGLGKSCSGVVYITNGRENKKVFPEELDYYLSIGFRRGGPKQEQETKDKRALAHVGKKYVHSEEFLKFGAKSRGKKHSEEHIKKVADSKRGKRSPKRKQVLCVETGVVYDGLKEAVMSTGHVATGALCIAIKNQEKLYGYTWKYID